MCIRLVEPLSGLGLFLIQLLTVMCAEPHSCSAVHHHGEQDTIVYAAKGHGSIVFDGGKQRKDLSPGDFAIIPA